MNTYYLKKFRKKAWKEVMIQYYSSSEAYTLELRGSGRLLQPVRFYTDFVKAKKGLQDARREIILTLLNEKKLTLEYNKLRDNRYLAEL